MANFVAQVKNNKTSAWELWHGVVCYESAEEAQKHLDIFLDSMMAASEFGENEIKKEDYRIINTNDLLFPHKFF